MSESIVVGTDGSETAKRAVAEAVRLAKALGAEVHVVCAHDPMKGIAAAGASGFVVVATEDEEEVVASTLVAAEASVSAEGVTVHTHAIRGNPTEALVSVAAQTGASLIVVGNQGMHGAKRVLGSVPNSVSHKARCNVLIVSTDQA